MPSDEVKAIEELQRKMEQTRLKAKSRNECRIIKNVLAPPDVFTLDVSPQMSRTYYNGVENLPSFESCKLVEFLNAACPDIKSFDMSDDLVASNDLLFGHVARVCVEEPPSLRVYGRTKFNSVGFANLQYCVEQVFMGDQWNPDLQGTIVQFGPCFFMFSSASPFDKCMEFFRSMYLSGVFSDDRAEGEVGGCRGGKALRLRG